MLAAQSRPVLRYLDPLPEGDGTIVVRLLSETCGLMSLQTKDFIKFLSLVAILYVGWCEVFLALHDIVDKYRLRYHVRVLGSGHDERWKDQLDSNTSLLWLKLSGLRKSAMSMIQLRLLIDIRVLPRR